MSLFDLDLVQVLHDEQRRGVPQDGTSPARREPEPEQPTDVPDEPPPGWARRGRWS